MQSPQAAARTGASQGIATLTTEGHCHTQPADANWRAAVQELQVQGLALRMGCVGTRPEGVLQLVVQDSVRASAVLRGPLADGEAVEIGMGADASPDVQFNRSWLDHALLRHRVQLAGAGKVRNSQTRQQAVDLAAR